jgi:protein-disulfide isomerase
MTAVRSDSVRMIYKEWPILGEASQLAARAALAADRQGQYPAFHARMMSTRLIPTPKLVEDFAAELAINFALAKALGLVGTPVLVVGRTIAQGDITRRQLERLIEDEMRPGARVC